MTYARSGRANDDMTVRSYASPEAFKQALEQRLRSAARASTVPVNRFRQLLVFDRFLARVFQTLGERAIAKGGFALELRLARARTTKDVDLRLVGPNHDVLAALRRAGRLDLGDWLSFLVERDKEMPAITGDGMVYDGLRFRAQAEVAGKRYGDPFGVDVGFADALVAEPDIVDGSVFLDFIGIAPARHRLYPRSAHIAEKLHAYSLPRVRHNTRVKDLPDLALLGSAGTLDGRELRAALEATFSFRSTHPLPTALGPPPDAWRPVYARMVEEDELPWATLEAVYEAARAFLDPVLAHRAETWNAKSWRWE
jgi:hypothetical protein